MSGESALEIVKPGREVRILFAEDNANDRDLCLNALQRADLEFRCDHVSTREEFAAKLSGQEYDLVLTDFRLPGWTGMDALDMTRETPQDIPVILVTGALGEEQAVECFREGIDDYVVKSNISALPVAVCRALQRKQVREERQRAEAALRESEGRFRTLAEATASVILIYQGTQCRYANRAAEEITGYTREELMATSSWQIVHPDSREVLIEQGMAHLLGPAGTQKFEIKILTKRGQPRWLALTIEQIELHGRPAGLFTGFDISERKEAERELLQRVACDPLTGVANSQGLVEAFKAEVLRAKRAGRPFSLLLLDVDGLGRINEQFGELAGSRALCRLARVLRTDCRTIDIVARYGGDEFAVLLPETSLEGCRIFGGRVLERLSRDVERPMLSVSVGAAEYPRQGETYETLFAAADRAMFEAKQARIERVRQPA